MKRKRDFILHCCTMVKEVQDFLFTDSIITCCSDASRTFSVYAVSVMSVMSCQWISNCVACVISAFVYLTSAV